MAEQISDSMKVRKLPWALVGGVANSAYVYLAFFGPVFLLFLDKIGLDKGQIGTVLAIVSLTSILAPFIAGPVARFGLRRSFTWSWTARTVVMALMVGLPWLHMKYGDRTLLGMPTTYVAILAIITPFALLRGVAVTALMPWTQEYIPLSVRGKFTAISNVAVVIAGALTMVIVGVYLGDDPALMKFAWLYVVAFVLGLVSSWGYNKLPGGEPSRAGEGERIDLESVLDVMRDRQFMLFVVMSTLVTLGWSPFMSFLPLYFTEKVQLGDQQVVFLDSVKLFAGLISGLVWGWAADRYGGKPCMLVALVVMVFYPVGLWLLPRGVESSYMFALAITVLVGVALPGWGVGYWVFVYSIMPTERKNAYNALHTAWILGMMAGIAPKIGGWVLGWAESLSGNWGPLVVDAYTPLIVLSIVCTLSAFALLFAVRGGGVPLRRFIGMFIQGSPVTAANALVAFQLSGEETQRVSTIEKLGLSNSLLSVKELKQAINDPSFNVRFEAIISMARMRQDPELTHALIDVLQSEEVDLAIAAAWALGRVGDREAIEPLRLVLVLDDYPLLRARAARALGSLGDLDVAPRLHEWLGTEQDPGVRLAYASALGTMRYEPALDDMLTLLDALDDETSRSEIAMAVATLLKREQRYVRVWQKQIGDPGDTFSAQLLRYKSRLEKQIGGEAARLCAQAANAFGADDLDSGATQLADLLACIPRGSLGVSPSIVADRMVDRLRAHRGTRVELVALALHALSVGLTR